ncbi:SUMF1/EgtB/PvdO family nonheme iron enzyme [bacterium]|nr:SUMF1/EgtB/PvdO family nonheme iron enzyme [bacterium]
MEAVPQTPTLGGAGLILLLAGFSLFIFHKRGRGLMIPVVICFVAGLSCITYSAYLATTVTNSLGEYDFADVDPGDYRINASAPGYYPEQILSFTVVAGANTAPDLTLYSTTPSCGDLVSTDAIVGNMRYVPGGTFTQGSPDGSGVDPREPCRGADETQFTHNLTRDLAVMETEITRQMWADLLAVQPSLPSDPTNTSFGSGMTNPVQSNTWYEAVLFANLLSLQNSYTRCYYTDLGYSTPIDATNYTTGSFFCDFDADGYRLASEGEWEYFCRGGTVGPFSCPEDNYISMTCNSCTASYWQSPNSNEELWDHAVFCGNSIDGTDSVGSKASNPWNLKDVHGNVWEWCWDWFGTYPGGSETDYEGAVSGSGRVVRGGGWGSYARNCRSASRPAFTPGYRFHLLGFRLVRISP